MLPLFALLLFGIFGIASLVIDMGYVSLTRNQMQVAADAAALEGLRQRDALPDAVQSDSGRRAAASQLVAWMFDDDFDLSADAKQLGAGPDVTMSGGVTELNALQTATLPEMPVYKPILQMNLQNEAHGDMVSGALVPNQSSEEDSSYQRTDFLPADSLSSPVAPAFLVRLRRTNDFEGLDNIPGESSSGRALPLLWGLGTTIVRDPNSDYSARVDGITVRATAIANARPALQVGLPGPLIEGVLPLTLLRSFWENLPVAVPVTTATVDASGTLLDAAQTAGRFAELAITVGQAVVPAPPSGGSVRGFAPIFQVVSGIERVVGFGHVQLTGIVPGPVEITRLAGQMGTSNASAHPVEGLSALSPLDLAEILLANQTLSGALSVPVLVR